MAQWKKLTREDLRAFDTEQTKAVLYAMDRGGEGRISSSGHCIIRNNSGQTMSVSRSSGGRRKMNVARDLVRLFGADDAVSASTNGQHDGHTEPARAAPAREDATPHLTCPARGCDKTFVVEGARYAHIEHMHHRCPVAGCDFVGRVPQSLVLHRLRAHEGVNPAKNRRKRAAEAVATEAEHYERLPEEAGGAPEPAPTTVEESPTVEANNKLLMIRELLGEDPRIAELTRRVQELEKERDDALAQLSLVREAIGLS